MAVWVLGVGWERMAVGCVWVPKALESISREEVRGQQYSLLSSTPDDGLVGLVSISPYLLFYAQDCPLGHLSKASMRSYT